MNYAQKHCSAPAVGVVVWPCVRGALRSAAQIAGLHDGGPYELLVLLRVGLLGSGLGHDVAEGLFGTTSFRRATRSTAGMAHKSALS